MTDAWARLEAALAPGVLESEDRAKQAIAGLEHARIDLDGGRPFRVQLFLWASEITEDPAVYEANEEHALEIFRTLADRAATLEGFTELDALREARFENHVVEALDVALFRSDALDLAIVADAPAHDVPVFVIAELWARRRRVELEPAGDPIDADRALESIEALLGAPLLGRDAAHCTATLEAAGWTLLREWDDAIALYSGEETARLAFHDGTCDLVAASVGAIPAREDEARGLLEAVAARLAEPIADRPPLDAIASSAHARDGAIVRLIADGSTSTLRVEIEPRPR